MKRIPVILFTYNRPELLRQTLESLSANTLASESDLIVYADGPKENASDLQKQKIQEVRAVIREKQWCKTVTIQESSVNKGLAQSIISGVSTALNKEDKVIVVEDDVLLSPYFLHYLLYSLHGL